MKTLTRKLSRTAITLVLVILAFIAIFRACVLHRISSTRDARFSADVVAIAPDVAGLITHVNVHDNQLVKRIRSCLPSISHAIKSAGGSGS